MNESQAELAHEVTSERRWNAGASLAAALLGGALVLVAATIPSASSGPSQVAAAAGASSTATSSSAPASAAAGSGTGAAPTALVPVPGSDDESTG